MEEFKIFLSSYVNKEDTYNLLDIKYAKFKRKG